MLLTRRNQDIPKHSENKKILRKLGSKISDQEKLIQHLREVTRNPDLSDVQPEDGHLDATTLTPDASARCSSPMTQLESSNGSCSVRPEKLPSDGHELSNFRLECSTPALTSAPNGSSASDVSAPAQPRTFQGLNDLTMYGFGPNDTKDSWWQVRLSSEAHSKRDPSAILAHKPSTSPGLVLVVEIISDLPQEMSYYYRLTL